MAIKKRKKKKGFRVGPGHRSVNLEHGEIPTTFDHAEDEVATNDNQKKCISLGMGFDPYASVRLWPADVKMQTEPVKDAKRSVAWKETDNNVMKFKIKREDFAESALFLEVADEEVGPDSVVGNGWIKIDEHLTGGVTKIEDFEHYISRAGMFAGEVTLDMMLLEEPGEKEHTLQLTIKSAKNLKKERGTDIAADPSTMFYVVLGFLSYLWGAGALFWYVEWEYLGEENRYPDDPDWMKGKITTWWEGFWFVYVTSTTVGFGDKFPTTKVGRILNSFAICFDVVYIGFALGLIMNFIASQAEQAQRKMQEKKFDEQKEYKLFIRRKKGLVENEIMPANTQEEVDEKAFADSIEKNRNRMFWWDLTIHTGLVLILIFGGSAFFYFESLETEDPWTYAQAFHFCFVTMSTVGYGDISPTKVRTQIVCIFYILFGVGLLVRVGELVCDKLGENQARKISQKKADESLMHWEQIAEFDVTGDGELKLDEFARGMLKATNKATDYDLEQIDQRFDMIDEDGSGYITKEDFDEMLKKRRASKLAKSPSKLVTNGLHSGSSKEGDSTFSGCAKWLGMDKK